MKQNYCKNCYWFKQTKEDDPLYGDCMKDAPQEKYRVKTNDFCKSFDDKDK